MKSSQGGFTLVEIAIVLVIIGLLLGGVLKGQELITQAKIRNVANDINGMSAAVYGYQDRYKKFPGDDNDAASRWTNPATVSGDGNGAVGVAGQATVIDCAGAGADGENCRFWQHLRLSGFVGGDSAQLACAAECCRRHPAGAEWRAWPFGADHLFDQPVGQDRQRDRCAVRRRQAQYRPGSRNEQRHEADVSPTDTAYVDDGSTVYLVCKTL